MSTVLRSLRSLVLKLAAATVFVAEAVGHWFSTGGDDLLLGGSRWLLSHIAQNPEAQRAVVQSYLAVSQAMQPHRATAIGLVSTSVGVVLVSVLLPPLVALLVRPRARVFVSFHRSREDDALALQQAMEQAGITVLRMPYSAEAQHQEVVGTPIDGIKRCHLFVCLPGTASSFVDHEVYAATAVEKPMAFVVSEATGTLPDSADKRYPVFKLEALRAATYAPLVQFMRHVAGDLRSTLSVVGEALRHPAVSVPAVWMALVAGIAGFGLLGVSLVRAWSEQGPLLTRLPAYGPQVKGSMFVSAVLLFLLSALALVAMAYAALVLGRLLAQFRARARMRRASAQATFRRDDWVGAVPGLTPGQPLYEALFDAAPRAHHEKRSGPAPRDEAAPAAVPRKRRLTR